MFLFVLKTRLRAAAGKTLAWAKQKLGNAFRPMPLASAARHEVFRSRDELLAENARLRQQLIVASRKVKKPAFRLLERGLLVLFARRIPLWRDALVLTKPETILRWHRKGLRLFWKRKSRCSTEPKPRLSLETIERIRRMAGENRPRGGRACSRRAPEAWDQRLEAEPPEARRTMPGHVQSHRRRPCLPSHAPNSPRPGPGALEAYLTLVLRRHP